MKIISYQKCNCGAITVQYENGASNSMYFETFNQLALDISQAQEIPQSYCCDHCVNHWGIDLCECGSHHAHDTLGVQFDSFGHIIKNFS